MRQIILNVCVYAKQKINLTWPKIWITTVMITKTKAAMFFS